MPTGATLTTAKMTVDNLLFLLGHWGIASQNVFRFMDMRLILTGIDLNNCG